MSITSTINRPPRIRQPLPQAEVKIPGPPSATELPKLSWFLLLLPLSGLAVMVAVYGGMRGDWLLAVPMLAMSGVSMLTSIIGTLTQRKNHRQKTEADQIRYVEALQAKYAELEDYRAEQQRLRTEVDPDLQGLLARANRRDPRLWERRPKDDDFLSVRLGLGDLPSTVKVSAPHPDMPDPRLDDAHAMEKEYVRVPDVPVTASLRLGPLGVAGALAERTGLARALLCNLAVHHAPSEVHLLAIYQPHRVVEWEWLKWLPHTHALSDTGRKYLADDMQSAQEVLTELLEELHNRQNQLFGVQPHEAPPEWPLLVLLVDDYGMVRNNPAINLLLSAQARQLNVTAIFLVDQARQVPAGCSAMVTCRPNGQLSYAIAGAAGTSFFARPDHADRSLAEQLARRLAPLKVQTLQADTDLPSLVRLLRLMGVKDLDKYDVVAQWKNRAPQTYLQVPIGERRGGQPMVLDLNHTGHGPHGLIAGTTGSGKSELVQTLVVALALTHHPHDVGFVLVDFKGGGTFAELQHLPHTLGMVTDLSGHLTQRALVALEAEMDRRKRLFNDAGVNDIGPYQELYWRGRVQDPLPRLVVIIDEFAELVSDYPDFMDGLIGIARVGRSLGVHLILATQSPAGVVKQQIWANAKFRICLRVESRQESQEMLHRPEAANLPRMPGRGYLQVGNNDVFELFQVARVAGTYRAVGDTSLPGQGQEPFVISQVSSRGERIVLFDSKQQAAQHTRMGFSLPTDIDKVVEELAEVAEELNVAKLPSPWPDPLPPHVALPDLLSQVGFGGWDGSGWVFDRVALPLAECDEPACAVCGGPLRPDAKFCGACGAGVGPTCPACGAALRPDAKFCAKCGAAPRSRCPACDSPYRPDAKFCPVCGQTLAAVPSAPSLTAVATVPPPRPPSLPHRPWLSAVLGLLDDPVNQRQSPFVLPLDEQDGQLIAVGAPGSGKEMWVRTLVTSLARTHAPDELHFYLLEFGGSALKVCESLPHVGGYFTPLDEERVGRLFRRLLDELEARKTLCAQVGVDSLVFLKELQPGKSPPAIVLILTGFVEFRALFQDELLQLTRLIREGGPYGVHVVLVGDRAADAPMSISSVVARRVVLRLADADEYSMVLGTRLQLSKDQSLPLGRGWYGRPPLEFQSASPGHQALESAQIAELQGLVDGMKAAVAQNRAAWQDKLPPPVMDLPAAVSLDRLLARVPARTLRPFSVPIGLDYLRTQPVRVDLRDDGPDFIVASTPQGGKTTLLTSWLLALAQRYSPEQVQLVLLAGRRNSLRHLQGLPHILDYCATPGSFSKEGVLARLKAEMARREGLLSEDPAQADGLPHVVVVFDDYDEFFSVVERDKDVTAALTQLARRGRDVEMHSIITGPLPNMGVSFSDPMVKQMKTGRSGFVLRILDATEQNPLGLRVRAAELRQMPPGRGYVVRRGSEELLQVATPGDAEEAAAWVERIVQQWEAAGVPPAAWPEPPESEDGNEDAEKT